MPNEAFDHALRQQRQHDQPGHDERAVADAVDLGDARADRRAEDDEIERGRDHRRDDALHQRAPGARHLEAVDRPDARRFIARSLTRPTKISSSELCVVCRSLKRDAGALQIVEQRGDAGALALRVIGVDQLAPSSASASACGASAGGTAASGSLQLERQLLLAELAHQLGLVLDQDDLALVDHADAVGHLLGFLDVVRGQDDGDAGGAQPAHHLPHVLAQLDVDAGGRLVEEQDARLVRQRLGDHHAALHAAGQRHDLVVAACPTATAL